jgi:hypothetical protein
MKNEKGNILIITIIILIVAVCFGVIGFLFAKKTETIPLAKINPSIPINESVVVQPSSENQNYFSIPELNIKFKTDSLFKEDLVYIIEKDLGGSPRTVIARVTSKSLIKEGGEGCKTEGLGNIIKVYADYTRDQEYININSDKPWWTTRAGLEKIGAVQFDGFYIWYQSPQSSCADKSSPLLDDILSTQTKKVLQSAKVVELIK